MFLAVVSPSIGFNGGFFSSSFPTPCLSSSPLGPGAKAISLFLSQFNVMQFNSIEYFSDDLPLKLKPSGGEAG